MADAAAAAAATFYQLDLLDFFGRFNQIRTSQQKEPLPSSEDPDLYGTDVLQRPPTGEKAE